MQKQNNRNRNKKYDFFNCDLKHLQKIKLILEESIQFNL